MNINYITTDLEVRKVGETYFIWSGRICCTCSFEDILLTSILGEFHLTCGQVSIELNHSEFESLSSIGFELDVVLDEPVMSSNEFSSTTRHDIKDNNDQCSYVLSNRNRCKNWVKGDSNYCAKHSLAEN